MVSPWVSAPFPRLLKHWNIILWVNLVVVWVALGSGHTGLRIVITARKYRANTCFKKRFDSEGEMLKVTTMHAGYVVLSCMSTTHLSSGLSSEGQLPDAEFSGLLIDRGSSI